ISRSKGVNPVLHAKPDHYSESDRKKLEDVQKRTRTEQERYHKEYKSAEEVRVNFMRDTTSAAAKKVDSGLKRLHLPCLPDLKDEFRSLAERLGVKDGH